MNALLNAIEALHIRSRVIRDDVHVIHHGEVTSTGQSIFNKKKLPEYRVLMLGPLACSEEDDHHQEDDL
ncbi:hypothetical protein DICVIV_09079 [Dictyocaulus viviparus]|uniref:Uncharacterized protein n=1 Tax=Dictyocaulus viviparus TaxID=29172 RepID=A0A0D8XMB3_DICVI|nr:hypothetical protein DICVIV_09079 [Dictyocaulus viviparus]